MELKDLFYGIQDFFVNVAFAPLDWLRDLQLQSWWAANALNIVFILIMMAAFSFWLLQIKKFNESEALTYHFDERVPEEMKHDTSTPH